MSENALGNLFTRMANSIRGGLGEIGKMKPITFPDKVDEIVSLLEYYKNNTGSGNGEESESPLKFASGNFKPTADRTKMTIEHGLGVMPDFVMVYMTGIAVGYDTTEDFVEANPILTSWGFKSNFDTDVLSGLNLPAWGFNDKQYGIDNMPVSGQNTGHIYCPNESTFQIGFVNSDGSVGLSANISYKWVAVTGLGSVTEPVTQPLTITENGTYTAPAGVDGYNPVKVDVPDPTKIVILEEQQFDGFVYIEESSVYLLEEPVSESLALSEGDICYIQWGGTEYECVASYMDGMIIAGNFGLMGGPVTEEPFCFCYIAEQNLMGFLTQEAGESHTIGIKKKVTQEIKLQDKTITENGEYTADEGFDCLGKVTVDVASSGSSSADVRYVTFMSYDDLVEYGKKAVAVGDDCADPIARGVFATPTRESDAQYNYTFYGWAITPNGAADANWNKAVTEDKTVYANFASAVRYYTITYYDSDGTTVLKTESLAYGSTPSYTPSKEGYGFGGWTPGLATVTGDASYVAKWAEKITFANASWEDIARISEAGEASEYFSVGDTKTVPFTFSGTTVNVTVRIIGFNHDDLADGSGKAGISIALAQTINNTVFDVTENSTYGTGYVWETSASRRLLNSGAAYTAIPVELRSVIKSVRKISNGGFSNEYGPYNKNELYTTNDKVWLLSSTEIGLDKAYSEQYVALGQGEVYEYFATNGATRRTIKSTGNTYINYATRSMQSQYACSSVYILAANGEIRNGTIKASVGNPRPSLFGFCV